MLNNRNSCSLRPIVFKDQTSPGMAVRTILACCAPVAVSLWGQPGIRNEQLGVRDQQLRAKRS